MCREGVGPLGDTGRVSSTVDALILCHNRPEEVVAAVASLDGGFSEIIVFDNGSEPPIPPIPGARVVRSDENTGVTRGRNLLLAETDAPYAVFLDDDAVALGPLSDPVVATFDAAPATAIIAFRIQRPGGEVSLEHPFRGKPTRVDEARPCGYFVGAGYAVRVDAVRAVGGYDDDLFYSTEEIDLSMDLQREGWALWYDPALRIEHRPSHRGRAIAPMVPAMTIRNRLVYVRRHLRVGVALPHALMWLAKTFVIAVRARGIRVWASAALEGLRRPVERRPLSWPQLREIHRRGGRVVF